jgi:uncharacterized protein HemX
MKLKSKKFIAIISVLAAVILLGVCAGVVFAQNQDSNNNSTKTNPVMARVAEILGIDQQKLEDAFNQAMKEQREQKLDQYLQKLVEDGQITSEQATQYKNWLESKPDFPLGGPGKFFGPGCGMQRGFQGCPFAPPEAE